MRLHKPRLFILLSLAGILSFVAVDIGDSPSSAKTSAPDRRAAPRRGEGILERALKGQARIIDLTHPLNANTPTYGGEPNAMRYERLAEIDRDGYAAGAFRVPEHFGTHVDAPGHFIKGKATVDQIEVRRLIAPAVVIDVRAKITDPDYQLTAAEIRAWERRGKIPDGAAVLLLTGWEARYQDASKYRNAGPDKVTHFPGYSEDAVRYLLKNRKVVALGIDTLSIDYGPSRDFAVHKLSLASGLYHIENLANLDKLPARGSFIFVGPLPIEGGSGSPARVIAIAP